LTQEQLAEQCGVTVNSVGHYEGGRAVPKVDTLERIAAATGKPLAWFFQDEDAAPAPAENPTPQPDMPSLLAQLVAAQVQMLQAQTRAEERQAEMAEAQAQTQARMTRLEGLMEAVLDELRAEGQEGCCGYGEGHAEGPGQASGDARRSA